MDKVQLVKSYRTLNKGVGLAEALAAVNGGWTPPVREYEAEGDIPILTLEEATADRCAAIRADFNERGLIALEYYGHACGCMGADPGMPECPCSLAYSAFRIVRDEVQELLGDRKLGS